MRTRELAIEGAYEFTPEIHRDTRGTFHEWFRAADFESVVGHPLLVNQANCSVSCAGTLRGIHYADLPPSQAKFVTCLVGSVLDVVVDIRVGSPTFGRWEAVKLDSFDRRCVYLSEGLGHAFLALEDDSVVNYLCSAPYAPGREHGVHPLDPALGITWPTVPIAGVGDMPLLSEKDAAAPGLHEAARRGLLPSYDQTRAFRATLRAR